MIKLKDKPTEPVRRLDRVSKFEIESGYPLRKLYDHYPDGYIDIDYDYNGDTYFIKYPDPETEEEYQFRYNKYLEQLEAYNLWYEKNKEEIENRETKKKEQYIKAKKTRVANLQKELAKAEVELSKVI